MMSAVSYVAVVIGTVAVGTYLLLSVIPARADGTAAPTPRKPEPPKTLTIEEGRALYDLGVTTGMAQAAMQTAQAKAKSAMDKLAPIPSPMERR